MFSIYANDNLVYSSRYQDRKDMVALAPICTVEVGKASSLSFILPFGHYLYHSMQKLRTNVRAYLDEDLIFNGRVLSSETDFYRQRTITCEGDLAFLIDSLQPPRDVEMTVSAFFAACVAEHNLQVNPDRQFSVGTVDVVAKDLVAKFQNGSYRDTRDALESDLIGPYGGYLRTRVVGDTVFLDYTKGDSAANAQTLEFGVNILDFSEQADASELFTVLLPTGPAPQAEEGTTAQPMTIESVNNGSKLLENLDGIAQYGRILRTEHFEDAADPADLKATAEALMERIYKEPAFGYTVKALDLHLLGAELSQFEVGKSLRIISTPHAINTVLTLVSIRYNMENIDDTELKIGMFSDALPSSPSSGGTLSAAVGGVTGGSGGRGGSSGQLYKSITETDDLLRIAAKRIELIAQEILLQADHILLESQARNELGEDLRGAIEVTSDKITAEVTRAQGEEELLSGRLTITESQILQEVTDRSNADATLQGKINVEADRITAEVTRSKGEEELLSGRLTITESQILQEVTDRSNADATLQGKINVEADRITAEVTRAKGAETTLSGRLTITESQILQEVTDRSNADTTLQGKINVEKDRITAEVTRAKGAETTLSGRLTVTENAIAAEVTDRQNAVTTLQGKINVEANRITAEVTRATNAETTISSRITVAEGAIALRVVKDELISSINLSPEAVRIKANKIVLSGADGIIVQGALTVQSSLSAVDARISNLVSGTTTATALKAAHIQSTGNIVAGSQINGAYLNISTSASIAALTVTGTLSATFLKYGNTDVKTRIDGVEGVLNGLRNGTTASSLRATTVTGTTVNASTLIVAGINMKTLVDGISTMLTDLRTGTLAPHLKATTLTGTTVNASTLKIGTANVATMISDVGTRVTNLMSGATTASHLKATTLSGTTVNASTLKIGTANVATMISNVDTRVTNLMSGATTASHLKATTLTGGTVNASTLKIGTANVATMISDVGTRVTNLMSGATTASHLKATTLSGTTVNASTLKIGTANVATMISDVGTRVTDLMSGATTASHLKATTLTGTNINATGTITGGTVTGGTVKFGGYSLVRRSKSVVTSVGMNKTIKNGVVTDVSVVVNTNTIYYVGYSS